MIVWALHRVHPEVIAHFEMLSDFFACESHHVELVLILIEIEHVAHIDRTSLDGGVKLQRSIECHVSLGYL